ncbi:ferredoxin--NADP reductase [Sphingomonas sp.]|uniref:ferredoxin--NADP reductase n=1 Tax=Sphingomonas sp. TaxID=28214 RepID=UPI003B00B44D
MSDLTVGELAPSAALSVEKVASVHHWNEHLFSFTITRPASFRFRSGEFVMIGLPDGKRPLLRAYSIASPAYAEELEFLSIKVPDGPLTSRLQKIEPGDGVFLGRKPTGTLVADALLPGKRLLLLSTGTGLAPFMSVIRDPDSYERFDEIVLVHSVRRVSDLSYRDMLEARLADDPLVDEAARAQFRYLPTVTREDFPRRERIGALIDARTLFEDGSDLNPETDRVMMCGSMDMIRELARRFEGLGFEEGSNAKPGAYVIERAFVG